MGFYAPAQIVRDAREKGGVEVRAIDINASDWDNGIETTRHAGLVPASNFPQALAPVARWTPEQVRGDGPRSEEHTSELQSLMRISYAVFCLKKKKTTKQTNNKNKIMKNIKTTSQTRQS